MKARDCRGGSRSKAQTYLLAKTPTHATARRCDTRNMLAELLLQGRTPRHELEAKPIVDHREPSRGKRDALTVDTRNMLAFGRRAIWQTSLD